LLGETARMLRELLIPEHLLLGENVIRTVIEAIIGKLLPLGIRIDAQPNFLGVETVAADLLGVSIGVAEIGDSI